MAAHRATPSISLLPRVKSVTMGRDTTSFRLASPVRIVVPVESPRLAEIGTLIADVIRRRTGFVVTVEPSARTPPRHGATPLWSEHITWPAKLELMAYPRRLAFAEMMGAAVIPRATSRANCHRCTSVSRPNAHRDELRQDGVWRFQPFLGNVPILVERQVLIERHRAVGARTHAMTARRDSTPDTGAFNLTDGLVGGTNHHDGL